MFRNTVPLLSFLLILSPGVSELQGSELELIKQAANVIDLSRLDVYPDHELIVTQRVEHLQYVSTDTSAFENVVLLHRKQLAERGGRLVTQPLSSDKEHQAFFSFDDFLVQLYVHISPYTQNIIVVIRNDGNLDLKSLPRNRRSQLHDERSRYPSLLSFTTFASSGRPVENILKENHNQLIRAGWKLYGVDNFPNQYITNLNEGHWAFYRNGATELKVTRQPILSSRCVHIYYHHYLYSIDEPPPPAKIEEFHLVVPDDLENQTSKLHSYRTSLTADEITEYYRSAYKQKDWKEVPPSELSPGSTPLMTFENDDRHQMLVEIAQGGDKRTVHVWRRDRLEVLEKEQSRQKAEEKSDNLIK